ncbi:uncharacterized protein K489DRAFT_145918 [Dissoconium aciculare CBS 342.82]|uniref:Uncharacterized protein n=1 Tax=Dissoconium aciculare CBS 342.82 TaxID=1314786 RepID=A0A6J3MBF7_9PEZI|nr:uncharacterized protein K489DRAFT_145918 [Dissoconium aciculare CBS 342.82]KAF1824964.1 hypothetical protein K489DRAFT_145918 [Dissoconium aciculare CBS 342.82]
MHVLYHIGPSLARTWHPQSRNRSPSNLACYQSCYDDDVQPCLVATERRSSPQQHVAQRIQFIVHTIAQNLHRLRSIITSLLTSFSCSLIAATAALVAPGVHRHIVDDAVVGRSSMQRGTK